ncbi:MAG: HPr kinase/phosphorylase, partial [Oscillospiraceae bacterium]
MSTKFHITLARLLEELNVETIYTPRPLEEILVHSSDVNRPGLQLAGFFDVFDAERVQVLGKSEMTYLAQLEEPIAYERLDKLFALGAPAYIITRDLEVPDMLREA